jgi:hypothetical protein
MQQRVVDADRLILQAVTRELDEFLGRASSDEEISGVLAHLPWHVVVRARFLALISRLSAAGQVSREAESALLNGVEQVFTQVSRRQPAREVLGRCLEN